MQLCSSLSILWHCLSLGKGKYPEVKYKLNRKYNYPLFKITPFDKVMIGQLMLVKNVMELCIDSEYYNIVKSTTTTAYKSTSTIDVCIYIYTAHCQGIKMKMHIVFNSKNYNDMIKKEEAIYPFLL